MEKVIAVFSWMVAHYQEICTAIVALLSGVIAVCLLIPGEQPEKFLQGMLDFIKKFSIKEVVMGSEDDKKKK